MCSTQKEGKGTFLECLTDDSAFTVLSANKAVFSKDKDKFGDDQANKEDEIENAFAKKEFCNVVVITSASKNQSFMFPFIK